MKKNLFNLFLIFILFSCAKESNNNSSFNSTLIDERYIKVFDINNGFIDINYNKITSVDPDSILQVANDYKLMKDYRVSVQLYSYIIKNHKNTSAAPNARWQIADIYINDLNEYELGIHELYKIINDFPESAKAENALFMIGYIYNNNLSAYSDAIEAYTKFLNLYPGSELIPSIEFELSSLENIELLQN
tara:strand:+ start:88 stop:657 length:570 start_codon:yes stop_codon:yes gene_type:complete